jgi:phosphoesterase RecJ-like protein
MIQNLTAFKELVNKKHKGVIVTHRNPDGDALGASLAWMFYLRKKGNDINFISPTNYTQNLKWINGVEETIIFENEMGSKMATSLIQGADVIYCLDFNAISRLESLGELIAGSKAQKVMIDHHQQPEDFASLMFSDTGYGATAEMIFDLIDGMGDADMIDTEIATNLYTGLATDTGFFQFNNATPNVYKVAMELVKRGASPEYISEKVNNVFHLNRLRYFGYCLNEKLKLVKNGKVAYMMLSQAEIKRFNLQAGDSEGLVNYLFKIEGVKVAVYFSEEPEKVKISFRSRGTIDVNTFARQYFEGGGHRNASGGKSHLDMKQTEKKFLDALETLDINQ